MDQRGLYWLLFALQYFVSNPPVSPDEDKILASDDFPSDLKWIAHLPNGFPIAPEYRQVVEMAWIDLISIVLGEDCNVAELRAKYLH